MRFVSILNRQAVQAERFLKIRGTCSLGRTADPDKAIRVAPSISQIRNRHVGHADPVAVGGRVVITPLRVGGEGWSELACIKSLYRIRTRTAIGFDRRSREIATNHKRISRPRPVFAIRKWTDH